MSSWLNTPCFIGAILQAMRPFLVLDLHGHHAYGKLRRFLGRSSCTVRLNAWTWLYTFAWGPSPAFWFDPPPVLTLPTMAWPPSCT